MTTTLEIAKSLLTPPGDTIQEHIDFIGMSQAELAERMGRPKEKLTTSSKEESQFQRQLLFNWKMYWAFRQVFG